MKTIKLPIKLNEEDIKLLKNLRREQSSVSRSAYKLFKENKSQKEIREKLKNNNYNHLDSWFIQCGIMVGKSIYNKFKEQKIIFGGRKNWFDYQNKIISKEDFKEKRTLPLSIDGESPQHGNRKFELNINGNNSIIFKPFKGRKIEIKLPKLKKNIKRDLQLLEDLTTSKSVPYSIKLYNDNIFISFEINEIKRLKAVISRPYTEKSTREKS